MMIKYLFDLFNNFIEILKYRAITVDDVVAVY